MSRAPVLCLLAALALPYLSYAKAKIQFMPSGSEKYAAKPEPCKVEVFEDSKPDREFVTLGVINYHDERHRMRDGPLKLEVAMPKIVERACKEGADAILDVNVTEVRRLEFGMFNVRVTAIRFVAPGAAPDGKRSAGDR